MGHPHFHGMGLFPWKDEMESTRRRVTTLWILWRRASKTSVQWNGGKAIPDMWPVVMCPVFLASSPANPHRIISGLIAGGSGRVQTRALGPPFIALTANRPEEGTGAVGRRARC
jgi:hypothetical protein